MGIYVYGNLVEVGEGEVEGTKYYFARINEPIVDANGEERGEQKVRLSLEKHHVKRLQPYEGDQVVVRANLKPNGKLEFAGLPSKTVTDLILEPA